jgi:hypothetical protein
MPLFMTTHLSTASHPWLPRSNARASGYGEGSPAPVAVESKRAVLVRTLAYSANHAAPGAPLALRLAPLEAPWE